MIPLFYASWKLPFKTIAIHAQLYFALKAKEPLCL